MHYYIVKVIIETLVGRLLCNLFALENSEVDIDVKPHCSLFSNSESLDNNIQSNQVHTCQADQKAWIDPRGNELTL